MTRNRWIILSSLTLLLGACAGESGSEAIQDVSVKVSSTSLSTCAAENNTDSRSIRGPLPGDNGSGGRSGIYEGDNGSGGRWQGEAEMLAQKSCDGFVVEIAGSARAGDSVLIDIDGSYEVAASVEGGSFRAKIETSALPNIVTVTPISNGELVSQPFVIDSSEIAIQ